MLTGVDLKGVDAGGGIRVPDPDLVVRLERLEDDGSVDRKETRHTR